MTEMKERVSTADHDKTAPPPDSRNAGRRAVRLASWCLLSVLCGLLVQAGTNCLVLFLDITRLPYSTRVFMHVRVLTSWWIPYGALTLLTWLLLALGNRKPLAPHGEAPGLRGVSRTLWVVYGAFGCFYLLQFVQGSRGGFTRLLQTSLGLFPDSHALTYVVFSLPHVLILGLVILWMTRACQRYPARIHTVGVLFSTCAVFLSMLIRIFETKLPHVPVLLPQISALVIVGLSFHAWNKGERPYAPPEASGSSAFSNPGNTMEDN